MSMTPQEAARRLGVLPAEVARQTANGIRRGLTYWRTLTIEGIRSKGVGRAIWAKKVTSLRPIIKRAPLRRVGDSYIGGLKLLGLASLQEVGGKTAAHTITASHGGRLAFEGRSGWVTPRSVKHPGSRIPAMPSAAPAVGRVKDRTREEIDRGLKAAIAKLGLN